MLHCLELVYDKNYLISQNYLFFKMVTNQTESSGLEQKSVIKFLEDDKCKPCEIYRRICNVFREACFSQRMFTNELVIGLPLWVWIKKTVYGEKIHWLSGKEKVPGAAVSKKEDADNF